MKTKDETTGTKGAGMRVASAALRHGVALCFLFFSFCLLPSAFCLPPPSPSPVTTANNNAARQTYDSFR
ncbi:MAG: hypothetical protein ACYTXY_55685, partial [Nostoc sp.]